MTKIAVDAVHAADAPITDVVGDMMEPEGGNVLEGRPCMNDGWWTGHTSESEEGA